ncbi:MAG: quinolinate synthase NadA, partial [Candidatus Hadarchaeales archaeon]
IEEILRLKERKNAVILAHNYQIPEIQDLADFVGDSLELAMQSTKVQGDMIVFCGVDFMAETAAILNPETPVLIPEPEARCPLAAQLPPEVLLKAKEEHPEAAVVVYVNTSARVKALSDAICTSANSPQVINALEEDEVLFGPDRNLAWFAQQRSKKRIIPVPADGHCYVHRMFSPADILFLKEEYPDAEVLVHPECEPEVQKLADHICSTSQMIKRARESQARRFLIATEIGLLHRLRKENPGKEFIPAHREPICIQMKKNTLEKVYRCLAEERTVVRVEPEVAERARKAINRMFELTSIHRD